MKEFDESFAIWLKNMRKLQGVTQQELADEVEVSVGTIGAIEAGHRNGSKKLREKIQYFFSVTPTIIHEDAEKISNPLHTNEAIENCWTPSFLRESDIVDFLANLVVANNFDTNVDCFSAIRGDDSRLGAIQDYFRYALTKKAENERKKRQEKTN